MKTQNNTSALELHVSNTHRTNRQLAKITAKIIELIT